MCYIPAFQVVWPRGRRALCEAHGCELREVLDNTWQLCTVDLDTGFGGCPWTCSGSDAARTTEGSDAERPAATANGNTSAVVVAQQANADGWPVRRIRWFLRAPMHPIGSHLP